MEWLKGSSAWRGGTKGETTTKQDHLPAVGSVPRPDAVDAVLGVALHVTIPAGGRGGSDVMLWIAPADFEAVARAMIVADPAAARRAFGQALVADADREG